ncbi:glycoside hydrolase family 28 protein [Baudoinia panamericana UAMH 10762]|uniref:endo-polygalacturonase n=1 Tax=Baudoinia panamericana (strain UAMH 10762) TaxID=717646 RepID=M2LNU0_BAUPA|nr:glycoside hydrolase family 28 protein [Baudoinia panamericana UAMH 10762]EMC96022.1 glycoside hydrolase family 28 protein [Baudoinia panamericana UAMH 10762]
MFNVKAALAAGTFAASTALALPAATTSATPTSTNPCYVTQYTAIPAATASCTAITLSNIHVPGNETLNLSKLKTGTTVTFAGTTTFGYADANYNMITAGGTNITITAEVGAIIDGNGQAWWDGQGSNGGMTKPDHFFTVSKALGNSVIKDLHIRNYPTHCFSISNCVGLVLENIVLDNSAGNAPNNRSGGLPAAHNSDGFDLSSCNNTIIQNSVVSNQDDCVAITSGNNITVSGLVCTGSHGLSIGSVGGKSNNNVTNITFKDSTVLNSQNGARIKSNSGTTGHIANVTYENIVLGNISTYGIDIQQDYLNGGPTGIPTNGVTITGVRMSNVIGTAQSTAKNYYILCGQGSCSDFTFENVHVVGGKGSSCNFEPSGNFVCAP